MSVLVRFGKAKAILRVGVWVSADGELEQKLNETTAHWIRTTGGPPIRERDQERGVATEMAKRFEGRILLHMRTRSRRSKDAFLSQRQLQFEFTASAPSGRRRGQAPTSGRQ